jgi:cyclic beta-1,2-glucan synthetase
MDDIRQPPHVDTPCRTTPVCRILAGGRHQTLITSSGAGFSTARGLQLTKWQGDASLDAEGWFFFVRDREVLEHWVLGRPDDRDGTDAIRTSWEPGLFTLEQERAGLRARLEVCVDPRGAELRCVTLTNRSGRRRWLDLTTAAEVVLDAPATYAAHPAFSDLFLQTAWVPGDRALLVGRRSRQEGVTYPHLIQAQLAGAEPEYETDRSRFVGRGGRLVSPRLMSVSSPLSNTVGNILTPLIAQRTTFTLDADESAGATFLLAAASDREAALGLRRAFADEAAVRDAVSRARRAAHRDLDERGLCETEAAYLQDLAGAMLYADPRLRGTACPGQPLGAPEDVLARFGIARDRPLAVLHAENDTGRGQRAFLRAAAGYWCGLGLDIEAVEIASDAERAVDDDGVTVLPADALSARERDLVDTHARLVLRGPPPALGEPVRIGCGAASGGAASVPGARTAAAGSPETLRHGNGLGGFSEAGDEYVIRLARDRDGRLVLPPRPWVNVIANEDFGCLFSETGAGTVWSVNSREHRLTPWANDIVGDPHDEAFFVRDEGDGAFWSCLPGPRPGEGDYEMRHGFGYSRCRHASRDLDLDTLVFVSRDAPVRFVRVRLANRGAGPRRLSVFAHSRLVLGDTSARLGRHVVTWRGRDDGVLFAENPLAGPYAARVAWSCAVPPGPDAGVRSCADRAAFLGPVGDPSSPAVLRDGDLPGRVGAGLDPCFSHRVTCDLEPGSETEVVFVLGDAADEASARELAAASAEPGAWRRERDRALDFWREILSVVRIRTPSPELDTLCNGWLLYQTLACRLWGRTALYQSGGAFGFRDQLQDASSLIPIRPDLPRQQILLHAAHQFTEGDVLHWWHPPDDRGLRTRFADDLLWLPLLTAEYVDATGDTRILAEEVPFLRGDALAEGEAEIFLKPAPSGEVADLYEHCCRAIDHSLSVGAHGLPLFGSGDWNDGMNRVGHDGRGESVWMGFFLCAVVEAFAPLCDARGDGERAGRYRAHAAKLREALERDGWDGGWYRRGFYDDGAPLGSETCDEGRIDILVQAWSVLSGAARPERAAAALDAADAHLVDEAHGLIRLLTPPFVDTPRDPGYIKGYVAGVRENGGQYTHAALWFVRALSEADRRERAVRLLEMINPLNLSATPARIDVYQVEPYVVAADVYGAPPHVGRGGWTWYTGSSGWMHRVILETVLGFRLDGGDAFRLAPRVPDGWPQYAIDWRVPDGETRYEIVVRNPQGRARGLVSTTLDGATLPVRDGTVRVPVLRDGASHRVEAVLGPADGGGA